MAKGMANGQIHVSHEIKSPRDGFKGRMEVTEEKNQGSGRQHTRNYPVWITGEKNRLEKCEQTLELLWDLGNHNEESDIHRASQVAWWWRIHLLIQAMLVRSLGRGDPLWQPTPIFLPGKSHGQRRLAGHTL